MAQGLSRGKLEAHKNLKLDPDFFTRMLSEKKAGCIEYLDFDVYLMEKSVMPLLLQGLDALSRHVDKSAMKDGKSANSRLPFNPLVWLAQYLLRNHPRYVKDHRTPMYERFSELASIERGRRCLLRKRYQMEAVWSELVLENDNAPLLLDDIPTVFQRLDDKWYLAGALQEKLPQDFSKVQIFDTASKSRGAIAGVADKDRIEGKLLTDQDDVSFEAFFTWLEEFVRGNDILRASAFTDAERRQEETEKKARKAEEDAARRATAMQEALERRSELEEQFETVTADMFINEDVSRILNKGAVIKGVEEKEGAPPLQGEHIMLIRLMLGIWGCPVNDDTDGDVWNDCALAAWQQWLKARDVAAPTGVDKATINRLMDKDEFADYLQSTFPVGDDEEDDNYVRQVVEVRNFVEDEIDILVEAIDEDTGELLHLSLAENEVEEMRQRLAEATLDKPVQAIADRVSGRIVSVMPKSEL